MIIRRCDSCNKILEEKDDYFTLSEMMFNKGGNHSGSRLIFSDKNKETAYDMKESWCSYTDLHFCPECFKKESLEKYLK